MGLLTLIQIPCHHVLANEIVLNLKYRIGIKHFFNITLGIGIIKNYFFCLYFRRISLCFYSNFKWESSLDAKCNSASNESSSRFSCISCFWGSRVHQKYAVWVIVGCGIKFCIQWALSLEIWVKTQGDISKIRTKKVVFLMIPISKFILKNCLRGDPFLNFKAFCFANTWWNGISIIFAMPILNWNFL